MESVWNEFRSAELDDDFQVVYESTFDYEGRFRQELYDLPVLRLPSHAPLDRLHYYLSIERGIHTPIFQTGLISEAGAPPPLRSASSLEAMKRYPEQLVIVGEPRGNSFIAGLLKRTYEVESEHGYFIVLRKASRERPASGSGG
jgi:hypothetical protein